MTIKRTLQWIVILAILVTSFSSTGGVLAWSGCASYITVQWGDTLSGLAVLCGTTVDAIRAANPGIGWWIYAGQVLYIPVGYNTTAPVYYPPQTAYGGTYVVQWGDTLGKIAASMGSSVNSILAVNPQIWNPSLIYAGQVINLPVVAGAPPASIPTPIYTPPPTGTSQFESVKITYKKGLFVRSGPGKEYKIINSALYQTVWQYRTNSITLDAKGQVWVEVTISPPQKGYSLGWILVKDKPGNYFTNPQINP